MEKDEKSPSWLDLMADKEKDEEDYYQMYYSMNGGINPKHLLNHFEMDDELRTPSDEFKFSLHNSMEKQMSMERFSRSSSDRSFKKGQMDEEILDFKHFSEIRDHRLNSEEILAKELSETAENGCVEPSYRNLRDLSTKEPSTRQERDYMMEKKRMMNRDPKCFCNCEKTKCLKMYCTCYRNGTACGPWCRCKQCSNKPSNREALKIKREAECRKESIDNYDDSGEVYCNCRTSFCEKSYCACARTKNGCSSKCKCFHCKNTFGSRRNSFAMPVKCF